MTKPYNPRRLCHTSKPTVYPKTTIDKLEEAVNLAIGYISHLPDGTVGRDEMVAKLEAATTCNLLNIPDGRVMP